MKKNWGAIIYVILLVSAIVLSAGLVVYAALRILGIIP